MTAPRRPRVFVTHNPEDLEAYYGRALPELRRIADVELNPLHRDLTTPELIDAARGCDVVVAHRSTPGERALFESDEQLVAFLRCAVDVSTVDLVAAAEHGVLVARADKSFVASTAELALTLALDVLRNVSRSVVDYRAGSEPPQRAGRQLRGRTAGIVGLGSIGRYLADVLVALGVRVVATDVDPPTDPIVGVEIVDLATLLAASDLLFPLVPGTEENRHLIGAAELAQLPPDAVLVNVGRGELLDEAAVAVALDEGRLGGLGMDVGQAPDQRPSPWLAGRPDVVATPHLGGLTPENADAQAASSVEQVEAIAAGRLPPRTIDPASARRFAERWAR